MFPDDLGTTGNLVVAVVQPLLMFGVLSLCVSATTGGFEPGWVVGAGYILAGLLWMSSIFLDARIGVNMVACLLLMFVLIGTVVVGATGVMADRGIRTSCVVTAIDKQTHTRTTFNSQSNAPSTTTETVYVHALACVDPKVDGITSGGRLAEIGGPVDVYYDPQGQVGPLTAETTDSHDSLVLWVRIALVAAVLLRVVAVVLEWLYPF